MKKVFVVASGVVASGAVAICLLLLDRLIEDMDSMRNEELAQGNY